MGLRLIAHYYDRNEALIVSGVLDAAGVTNFIESHGQISLQPFSEVALGGYRLVTPEEELSAALDAIRDARRAQVFEGGRLTQRTYIVLSLVLLVALGLPLPLRTSSWHDVGEG